MSDDDVAVQFTYEDWLTEDKSKLLFKGKTYNGCEIVIKFTQRYNVKAHHLCAKKNFAQKLFYVSNINLGGWYMIVMKYINVETLQTANITKEEYDVLKNIQEAIDTLHTNDIIFGDLHSLNIMIEKVHGKLQVMLIDFGWAGIHQKDCYTPIINPEIKWASGAEGNALIHKDHDLHWLELSGNFSCRNIISGPL
ncbi:11463_t:CDS:2 [Funneliformis geosporum]|nr:11463_t:CDS:2 [Funneliformis geosporum]